MTTLAELNDRVYMELGAAEEFAALDEIHNAVSQKHNVRVAMSQMSSVNVLLGVSAEFTPTATTYDVTALIGKGVPSFLEMEGDSSVLSPRWSPIRIVNINQLEYYAQMGVMAAAFYGEDAGDAETEAVQYVQFTSVPGGPCRIRFDKDSQRIALTNNIQLPDNVADLIVKEAQNLLIPRIKLAITMRIRQDPALKDLAADIKNDLTEIYAQNVVDIEPLKNLWKVWAFRDRANESSFNKPTPNSGAMYAQSDWIGSN